MYPTLPFGPLSLPTGPVVMLLAATLGLEITGRYGRRLGLSMDDVWNTGLLALLAGLIVARLWNVVEFWPVYSQEPGLILSLRPSGFVFWPGVVAALVAAYANLLRRALDPVRVAAAFAVGLVAAAIVLSAGAYLTGSIVGTRSELPWALPYFGETRHPVALYQAFAFWLLFIALWLKRPVPPPGRTVLLAGLAYALIHLFTAAFIEEPALLGPFRRSQVIALAAALVFTLLLARQTKPDAPVEVDPEMRSPAG
jgi:phosphatidylglycerol:prolipoprotein diacylglycerol transferase